MVGLGPNREEFVGSQREDQFLNLERRRDREFSVHTMCTSRSQSRSGSQLFHEENTRSMQLEINHLLRRLHCERRRKTSSSYNPSSDDNRGGSYGPRSRSPPSEPFSYDEDHHYKHRSKSPSCRGLGNGQGSRPDF